MVELDGRHVEPSAEGVTRETAASLGLIAAMLEPVVSHLEAVEWRGGQ